MKKNDDFYIGYVDQVSPKLKGSLKKIVIILFLILIVFSVIFSFSQKTFENSTFELTENTRIEGIYLENPYPMLRVDTGKNTFKDILLLGFGKAGAEKYLKRAKAAVDGLNGKKLSIEGNLIYYNGKTLMQILDDEKVVLESARNQTIHHAPTNTEKATLYGEIIDPKCYFGVMKPGKGKIHRSCAVRCISGGIPPVFATTAKDGTMDYFLLTDMKGNPVNNDVLPYIGKPAKLNGILETYDDWNRLKIEASTIEIISEHSKIY